MGRWGQALAGAAGAVANVGVQALDRQIQTEQTIAAEQRAADLKLNMAERMAAAEEMRKNAAGIRFTNIVQKKLDEEIPLEAPGVDDTGLSRDSAIAPTAEVAGASFEKSPEELAKIEAKYKALLASPDTPDKDKEDIAGLLDAIERQKKAQGDLNAKSVAGKTRKRTTLEARDAAFQEAGATDLGALTAGTSAWKDAMSYEREDKKGVAAAAEKDADRASREQVARIGADQRAASTAAETERKTAADAERAAYNDGRLKAAQARTEALAGGKGAKATALMQNYDFLTQKLGKSSEEAQKVLFQAKDSSEAEKVFKLMLADKYGELTVESAFDKVRGITSATAGAGAGAEKIRNWNPKTRKFE